ncbi:MAG: hypothetical protein RI922_491 [Bacteroidota bacterium]|jgi:uncharacterized protein YndB with AHSA1/START domain
MINIHFKISINAPVNLVFDKMLGLTNKATYEHWTAAFNPTSSYEGNWGQGQKMLFVGVDENGEKGGMISRIVAHEPNRFISIQHYGILKGDVELTEGEEVEEWAGGLENYTFEETNGTTTVRVDLDTAEDFLDYMNETYPLALAKLKKMCEG